MFFSVKCLLVIFFIRNQELNFSFSGDRSIVYFNVWVWIRPLYSMTLCTLYDLLSHRSVSLWLNMTAGSVPSCLLLKWIPSVKIMRVMDFRAAGGMHSSVLPHVAQLTIWSTTGDKTYFFWFISRKNDEAFWSSEV